MDNTTDHKNVISRDRNHYDEKFKMEVVQNLISGGKPVTEVALSLGIEQSILYRWKKKYERELIPRDNSTNWKQSEYEEIRKELESLKTTVEQLRSIIKKSFGEKYCT